MDVSVKGLDLAYEANFESPAFDVLGQPLAVLKSLHETVGRRFSIDSADMHVYSGTAVSDIRIHIDIFGGYASIDVTADRLSVACRDLQTTRDLDMVVQCIESAAGAIGATFPSLDFRSTTIRMTGTLNANDRYRSVADHIAETGGASLRLDLSEFAEAIQIPGIHLDIENTSEGWRGSFAIRNLWGDQFAFFISGSISCEGRMEPGCLIGKLRRFVDSALRGAELDLSGFSLISNEG